jgi:hypothetical protein
MSFSPNSTESKTLSEPDVTTKSDFNTARVCLDDPAPDATVLETENPRFSVLLPGSDGNLESLFENISEFSANDLNSAISGDWETMSLSNLSDLLGLDPPSVSPPNCPRSVVETDETADVVFVCELIKSNGSVIKSELK